MLVAPWIERPTKKPPRGHWRRWLARAAKRSRDSQRWQAETVNSTLKRLLVSALRA